MSAMLTMADLDRQQKMLVHALEWSLGCIDGGPDGCTQQYKAARSLLDLLKGEGYDWVYEVEMEIQSADENLED